MNWIAVLTLLIWADVALALPKCADKYLAARHDAERVAMSVAFRTASKVVPGVPFELALAVGIVESGLNQEAVSNRDAVGIMQITTEAEEHILMLQRRSWRADRNQLKYHSTPIRYLMSRNIWLGFNYLGLGLVEAGGSIDGALIFYNSGYYGLTRWKEGRTVPNETAQYVLRVLRLTKECSK